MEKYAAEKFLDKIYGDLYLGIIEPVSSSGKTRIRPGDNRYDTIGRFLDKLDHISELSTTEHQKSHLLNLLYEKFVIKAENIPEPATDEVKQTIIDAQKKKLQLWVDYLTDKNCPYPSWARYWAFRGMLKMGVYDELSGKFTKRDEHTIEPFIDMNPEIVAKAIGIITKLVDGEDISDIIEERLSKTDSFSKIYLACERQYHKNIVDKSDSDTGIWIKYNQGNKDDAIKLFESLENKNTGWCTGSMESFAYSQLCGPYVGAPEGGDFYVYYTKDKDGKYTVPRIAIRLVGHTKIGEIRGILEGQNLEEGLEDVLEKKLLSLEFLSKESIDESLKQIEDLRKLIIIGKKTKAKEPLTDDEIIDIHTKKFGFGWEQDYRAVKILKMRDVKKDFESMKDKKNKIEIFIVKGVLPMKTIDDKDLVLRVIKKHGAKYIDYAIPSFLEDKEFVMAAAKINSDIFAYIPKEIRSNYIDLISVFVKDNGMLLRYIPEDYKLSHFELNIEAIKNEPRAIDFVPKKIIKEQPELFCSTIVDYPRGIKQFPIEYIIANPIHVELAIRTDPNVLEYIPGELIKKHRELVLAVIRKQYYLIKYLPKDIDNYLEFARAAIKKDSWAIEYIPNDIDNYESIILELVEEKPSSAYHIPLSNLFSHIELFKKVLDISPGVITSLSEKELEEHSDLVIRAVRKDAKLIKRLPHGYKYKHPEVLLEDIKHMGSYSLERCPVEILEDHPELIIEAVKNNASAIKFVEKGRVRSKNPGILVEAVKANLGVISYYLISSDLECAKEAVKQCGLALRYFHINQEEHIDIVLDAIKQDGRSIDYVRDSVILNHPTIILDAVKQTPEAIKYVNENVLKETIPTLIKAAKINGNILHFLSREFIEEYPGIAVECVKQEPAVLGILDKTFLKKHPEIITKAIEKEESSFLLIPKDLKEQPIKLALINKRVLKFIPASYKAKNIPDYLVALINPLGSKKNIKKI